MKKILLLLILAFFGLRLYPQKIALSKDVEKQYTGNHGPNMRHYGYVYYGLGVVPEFNNESGVPVKFWGSGEYFIGYRYKLKLLSFYALGLDMSYAHTRYNYNIDDLAVRMDENPLTFESGEKRHLLVNNALSFGVYQRINFGKRGNTLGNYLDIGLAGSWNYATKEVIVKEFDTGESYAGKMRTVNRKLDFTEPLTYGLTARIGHNKFAVYGKYRLSDYFKGDPYAIPELPRLRIGIEMGI